VEAPQLAAVLGRVVAASDDAAGRGMR